MSITDGVALVSGELSFDTVTALQNQGFEVMSQQGVSEFNLSGVSRSDSSGLALLISWRRFANKNNQQVRFSHFPQQLRDIASVSGLDGVLEIQR